MLGSRVAGLHTDGGDVYADLVIDACGMDSPVKNGLPSVCGVNPDTGLVEIIELPAHPFFIATQFHPEYKSTPEHPQPLFVAFVKAALEKDGAGN